LQLLPVVTGGASKAPTPAPLQQQQQDKAAELAHLSAQQQQTAGTPLPKMSKGHASWMRQQHKAKHHTIFLTHSQKLDLHTSQLDFALPVLLLVVAARASKAPTPAPIQQQQRDKAAELARLSGQQQQTAGAAPLPKMFKGKASWMRQQHETKHHPLIHLHSQA
jgi:hypothetical protein